MKERIETYYSCDYCGCEGTKETIEYHESYCSHNPYTRARFQPYVGKCYRNGNYTIRYSALTEEGMKIISVLFDRAREMAVVRTEIWDLDKVEDYAEDYEEIPVTDYISMLDNVFKAVRKW